MVFTVLHQTIIISFKNNEVQQIKGAALKFAPDWHACLLMRFWAEDLSSSEPAALAHALNPGLPGGQN